MPDSKSTGASIGITSTSIPVQTTATLLATGNQSGRRSVMVFNNQAAGGTTMYLGNASVIVGTIGSANGGLPVPPQTSVALDLSENVKLFGVATSVVDARVLEIS